MAEGVAADINQMRLNQNKHGAHTIREQAIMWTKDALTKPGYISGIAQSMHMDPNARIDFNDPEVAKAYLRGAQQQETAPFKLAQKDIDTGADIAFGRANANPNFRPGDQADPNVNDFNTAQSRAENEQLRGSNLTMREGEFMINQLHDARDGGRSTVVATATMGWNLVGRAVDGLAAAVRSATAAASQAQEAPH
jgi:hypothetical protein